jgi:hypothetical protein
MEEALQRVEFYGVLGRTGVSAARANLRFYPYEFSLDLEAKAVFSVDLLEPRFDAAALAALDTHEIFEIAVFSDRLEFSTHYTTTPNVLTAASVHGQWLAYDADDFLQHIRQLETRLEESGHALANAARKNDKGAELTRELLRRAELKSDASDELRSRQAAAIVLLKRFIRHFEDD